VSQEEAKKTYRTKIGALRWFVVVYKYEDDFPREEDDILTEEPPIIVQDGITSISIERNKRDPNGPCVINIVGDLHSSLFIGNWIVVKTTDGKLPKAPSSTGTMSFTSSGGITDMGVSSSLLAASRQKTTPKSALPELAGITRFIGQITDVTTEYTKDSTGNFRRRSVVVARPWSSMLQMPIRYDLASVAHAVSQASANAIGYIATKLDEKNSSITELSALAQKLFNPWGYAGLVLKLAGALSESTEGTILSSNPSTADTLKAVEQFPDIAVKMPNIPQQLLDDVGAYDASPFSPFTTGDGFVAQVFGVHTRKPSNTLNGTPDNTPDAWPGYYTSKISAHYEIPADRPLFTGVGAEFTKGDSIWNILTSRLDNTMEVFADIWYLSPSGDPKEAIGKPVLIVRDRPFAIRRLWNDMNSSQAFSAKWTIYDDLPRTYIDSVLIQSVRMHSTFRNSPNYVLPHILPGLIKRESSIASMAMLMCRVRLGKEMSRFGGIEDFFAAPFGVLSSDKGGQDTEASLSWFADLAGMNYLWKCLDYRYLRGTMNIIDTGLFISVGNNITFKLGKNTIVAHVEGVHWNHTVSGTGMQHTECQITFSHACYAHPQTGELGFIGPAGFNNIFEEEMDDTYKPSFASGAADFKTLLSGLDAVRKVKEAQAKAQQALREAQALRLKLPF